MILFQKGDWTIEDYNETCFIICNERLLLSRRITKDGYLLDDGLIIPEFILKEAEKLSK